MKLKLISLLFLFFTSFGSLQQESRWIKGNEDSHSKPEKHQYSDFLQDVGEVSAHQLVHLPLPNRGYYFHNFFPTRLDQKWFFSLQNELFTDSLRLKYTCKYKAQEESFFKIPENQYLTQRVVSNVDSVCPSGNANSSDLRIWIDLKSFPQHLVWTFCLRANSNDSIKLNGISIANFLSAASPK
ncbi:hypothetical protein Aconfl_01690 [Algoriphagus confluentis]|uniref:Uncharacterized protein n=1 Tax=Algoriphagus confluentis TaxID=1697556 RepID=A0ABQ6PI07_9BACT|nr:hypothetical protein Aconfl_01690 [Algoriphagus confluentis]